MSLNYCDIMQFKKYSQGNLEFISVNVDMKRDEKLKPIFLFEDEYYNSEDFAIKYFKSKGYGTFFSENSVWQRLLLLLFYDELEGSPRKYKRISLIRKYFENGFYEENKEKFLKRFEYLKTADLLDEVNKFKDIFKINKTSVLCKYLETEQILIILYDMVENYSQNYKGFPDLMVFDDENLFFCEVKGHEDSLSKHQVLKHELLLNTGVDVSLFCINKSSEHFEKEKSKYFNEFFYDPRDFDDKYNSILKVANSVYKDLKEDNIDEFKRNFLNEYDLDTFIAFLNVISDFSHSKQVEVINNIPSKVIRKSEREAMKLQNLRILNIAQKYEKEEDYLNAIEEYKKVKNFKGYKGMCNCYRSLKDYGTEIDLIYDGINNVNYIKTVAKNNLKRRAYRLFKNKKKIETYKTNIICPDCGNDVILTSLERKGGIKIFTCTGDDCYWYGGIYEGDLADVSNLVYSKSSRKIINSTNIQDSITENENIEKIFVFCTNCGTKNDNGDNFCYKCGNKLKTIN